MSIQERFEAALEAARARGVHVKVNVMTCCRNCATHEDIGLPSRESLDTTPWAYAYGGQGNELLWREGIPIFLAEGCDDEQGEDPDDEEWDGRLPNLRLEYPANKVYFNHGGPDLVAAQALAEAFRTQGFEVEGGTEDLCVVVTLA